MIKWQHCEFRETSDVLYHEIRSLDFMEYVWLVNRRQLTNDDALAVKKFRFLETFVLPDPEAVEVLGPVLQQPGLGCEHHHRALRKLGKRNNTKVRKTLADTEQYRVG